MEPSAIRDLVDEFNAGVGRPRPRRRARARHRRLPASTPRAPRPTAPRTAARTRCAPAWAPIFADANARFTTEDAFVADGDRFVQTWRYDFAGGHIRGIDVIEVRDGLISAKLSYVKG